jgi:Flp pilus assembly protein TadD/SAM-dependent methyltransferase
MQGRRADVAGALAEADGLLQAGRLDEAARLCGQILAAEPGHAGGLHLLGMIAHQAERPDEAIALLRRAVAANTHDASFHSHLGNALCVVGMLDEAAASYRQALLLQPNYAEAHNNLGNTLFDQGKRDEAVASYRQALVARPGFAGAHNNLGAALWEEGMLEEALACFRRALALEPDFAGALINLGNALFDHGELDEAIACYRQAIALRPGDVEAYGNLGIALWDQGKLDEAETLYHQSLALKPDDIASLNNLAALLLARGHAQASLELIQRSLAIAETGRAKKLFADIVQWQHFDQNNNHVRATLVRALNEPWGRPGKLMQAAANLVKLDPIIGPLVAQADKAVTATKLLGAEGIFALEKDALLAALLTSAPNVDPALERFLTLARRLLLESAIAMPDAGHALNFAGALARQCFINEYVFFHGEEEIVKAKQLRDKLVSSLESGHGVAALPLLVVACYFPLHSIFDVTQLLERSWPAPLAAVVVQQVREPKEEWELRVALPRLTEIEDAVSQQVQRQYEENPYPRWIKLPPLEKPTNIMIYLARRFPLAPITRRDLSGTLDVLVAGCGTGQQSITAAERTTGTRVLAIDLSLSSLAYALRKTRERDAPGIEYAQADILKLGALGRDFDVIECSGVLHHMADPWAGLCVLLTLLRPGGFMRLGFYSRLARRDVVKARDFIAARGYEGTADEIRLCRQQFLELGQEFSAVVEAEDFFSVSTCRDLIFNVQEHRMAMAEIATFLHENQLTFLGFEFENEGEVLNAYRLRFPGDPAAIDLDNWQAFEEENPQLFSRTYLFWVQKILLSEI